MRETVMWSYNLLSPAQKGVFCRLAAFVSPCSIPAAAAVCFDDIPPTGEVLEHLATLAEKSLIVPDDTGPELRYRFVEPVGRAARELFLACACVVPTRSRHLAYYLRLAEAAALPLPQPESERRLAQLRTDRLDVEAALAWSVEQPDPESGLRLVAALTAIDTFADSLTDLPRAAEALLASAPPDLDPTLVQRARAAVGAA